ncbi:type VI secretion system baseplate subunit TssE [Massilia sp. ST3]|uniref:type VI secretion system baseplate subunit TssE n=1 Tax=Massilia sp. ST3 TaxID=2824903 RepID=UPI001B8395E7|nr:type VI secretion system baseplate subunit TssE [Massilia sp. ST3]MBQ5949659.1 type VI secretion system baseplate subunit TssE [Massilia sp. ST3]
MNGFTPGLLDRLMDERTLAGNPGAPGAPVSLEQLKDSIARDLEALLNTRLALPAGALLGYPAARASILHYGVGDFAAFCLGSSVDRALVCASLKDAIETHEPRLREVSAELVPEDGSVNRLGFVIHARLAPAAAGDPLAEPVNFSAVLQPSSLRYAIKRATRPSKA